MLSALRLLSILTLLLAFFVASYGAYVRLNDAGLDCPDWPGCYGQVTPPDTAEEIAQAEASFDRPVDTDGGWKEMNHRYVASFLGFLILVMMGFAMWGRDQIANMPYRLGITLAVLVCIQGGFGIWTVSGDVHPIIVTMHLTLGMTLIGLLAWFACRVWALREHSSKTAMPLAASMVGSNGQGSHNSRLKALGAAAVVVLMLQIILGGWTSTNYAAAYCADFPGCQGYEAWPETNFAEALWINPPDLPERGDWEGGAMSPEARKTIHMSHRVLAAVVTLLLVILIVAVRLSRQSTARQRATSLLVLAALVGQISIGIATVIQAKEGMPVTQATLHNTGAALLLCALLWLNFCLRYPAAAD